MDRHAFRGAGAQGFSKKYWDRNYGEPQTMDGVYNAREHALSAQHFFRSEYVEVGSIIALGFGLGFLFEEMMAAFVPHTAAGIEPSSHAFHTVKHREISPVPSTLLTLEQIDIVTWCEQRTPEEPFDLGICSSVFQYLTDEEIQIVLPVMAKRMKYLYFSVPTNVELSYQAKHLSFDDTFACSRTREEYREMISEHFTVISRRILESKVHFDFNNSPFDDDLFRY